MKIYELDTPALIVDLDVMERNLQRMADYCSSHGIGLRPHTKTHKSPEIAHQQLALGATGITVAKLGEAEVMVDHGLENLLLAYPVFGPLKTRRLASLRRRAHISVALDSMESADWVAKAGSDERPIEVLIEIDFGMRRCGLAPGEAPIELARHVLSQPGLRLGGILFYSGHLHPDLEKNTEKVAKLNRELNDQLELFREAGIEISTVSGGNTPGAFYSHMIDGITEIRPGTYIFNDRNTVEWGSCTEEDCAASLLVTVISIAVPGQAIVDGGSKTFTSDPLGPGTASGHGVVKGYPGIEFFRMNEEHGYLRLPDGVELELGQKLEIIPNHICVAVNLHDTVWGYRGDEVVSEWPVKARGLVR